MKRKLLYMLFMICMVIPCAIVLVACGGGNNDEDNGPVTNITVSMANDSYNYDDVNHTITVEYGNNYNFTAKDFKLVATYQNGKTRNLKTSEFQIETIGINPDEITPAGDYTIYISYRSVNYSYDTNVYLSVRHFVEKPTLSTNTLTYNGDVQSPEIIGFNEEYMRFSGVYEGIDVGRGYFYAIDLNPYCVWKDGSVDEITCMLEWEILPLEIPTPIFEDYQYNSSPVYSFMLNISNSEEFDSLPDFDISDDIYFSTPDMREAGDYDIELILNSSNFIFSENKSNTIKSQFTITPYFLDIPEIILETTYGDGKVCINDSSIINNYHSFINSEFVNGEPVNAGEHQMKLFIAEWHRNSCLWNESDIVDGENVIVQNDKSILINWKINPKEIATPTYADDELEFTFVNEYTSFNPTYKLREWEGVEFLANDNTVFDDTYWGEIDAGEYTFTVYLTNPEGYTNYIWQETKDTRTYKFNWKINKRNYGEGGGYDYGVLESLKAKNTFDIDDIQINPTHELSTYQNEEDLPFYVEGNTTAWIEKERVDKSDYVLTTYTYTDSYGIIWVKNFYDYADNTLDKYDYHQTLDLSGKEVGDTQYIYLTFFAQHKNYNDKAGILTKVNIAEKGSQYCSFNYTDNWETPIYGEEIGLLDVFASGNPNPKIQYRFFKDDKSSTIEHGSQLFLDVGSYTNAFLLISGSEDYEDLSITIKNITICPRPVKAEEVQASATGIKYLENLTYSELTGFATVYGKTIEGALSWVDSTICPTFADANKTEYEALFTPTSGNYAACTITLKLNVGKAVVNTYAAPRYSTYGNEIFEGDLFSEMVLYSSGQAYNLNDERIGGEWELLTFDNKYVGEYAMFRFTPEDLDTYEVFEIDYENPYTYTVQSFELTYEPYYMIYLDGKHYSSGGIVSVTYKRVDLINPVVREFEASRLIKNRIDENYYTLQCGKIVTEQLQYSEVAYVSSIEEFEDATRSFEYVVIIDGDVTVDCANKSSIDSRMYGNYVILEDSTLTFTNLYLDIESYNTDLTTEANYLSHFTHFLNFGTLNVSNVEDGNIYIHNFGTANLSNSLFGYMSFLNEKDATINVETWGEVEDPDDSDNYTHYSDFRNDGTINFLYYGEDPVIENGYMHAMRIARESYNTGILNGCFDMADANLNISSGSYVKSKCIVTDDEASGRYSENAIIRREPTVTIDNVITKRTGRVKYEVKTEADFVNAIKLANLSYAGVDVIITQDLDVSNSDAVSNYQSVSTVENRCHLFIAENNSIIINMDITLNIGDKTIALEHTYYPDRYNYAQYDSRGTLIGNIRYGHLGTDSEYKGNYIIRQGNVTGTITN